MQNGRVSLHLVGEPQGGFLNIPRHLRRWPQGASRPVHLKSAEGWLAGLEELGGEA
jgi:hypothetical protein